ncbi:hypothetical protein DPMN_135713 [Dreissena polymorpha]|uniref:Uncharacterized protein n=1 Tax=Dreissena polymorpha TaxID=45954 RepID=A0A9D4G1G7_DREPO|nr:hypothetical protein DPMN_135713 [Dreissena polymorpha]
MKRAKLLKGTGIYLNEDLTKTNSEVLASLRLKEPLIVERAWSRDGKLFVGYRGHDRIELVSSDKYRLWSAKPWPNRNQVTSEKNKRLQSFRWRQLETGQQKINIK